MDVSYLTEWTKRMEYQGKLPEHTKIFFNAATSVIWGQIVENIIARQEVEKKRKSLIIHTLTSEEVGKGSKVLLGFPINEVEVWKKLQETEKSVDNLKLDVEDKDKTFKSISRRNKTMYIKLENLSQKIKEYKQKSYLYREKSKKLEEEISSAEEKLAYFSNLIQIEPENPNYSEISEDLNVCCNKLVATMKSSKCSFTPQKSISIHKPFRSEEIFSLHDQLEEEFEQLRQSKELKSEAQKILSTHNKNLVWNVFRNLEESVKVDLNCFLRKREINNIQAIDKSQSGRFVDLHSIHVQKQLEALKFALKCKVLERNLRNLEEKHYVVLRMKNVSETSIDEIKGTVQTRLEEFRKNTNMKATNRVLGELREGHNKQGLVVSQKLRHQGAILNSSIHQLSQKQKAFDVAQKSMLATLNDTAKPINKLVRFIEDSWLKPLSLNLHQNEVNAFQNFRLNLNRKYFYAKSEEFMRDFSSRCLPYEEELDSDLVLALADFTECPFQCPEATLLNVLQTKLIWKTLEEIKDVPVDYQKQIYVLESLKSEESYVDYVMEKLRYMTSAGVEKQWLECSKNLKEVLDVWVEMPFKDAVSPTRLFNGESYKFYEDAYDSIYNQLE